MALDFLFFCRFHFQVCKFTMLPDILKLQRLFFLLPMVMPYPYARQQDGQQSLSFTPQKLITDYVFAGLCVCVGFTSPKEAKV